MGAVIIEPVICKPDMLVYLTWH